MSACGAELKHLAAEMFTTLSTPSELPLVTQLFITILGEIVRGSRAAVLAQLSQLRGHPEQWCQTVGNLHEALREEFGSKLDHSELLDLYSKLAANARETDDKRAAVFCIGSLAEHSCRPSAFKCVLAKRHNFGDPSTVRPGERRCCITGLHSRVFSHVAPPGAPPAEFQLSLWLSTLHGGRSRGGMCFPLPRLRLSMLSSAAMPISGRL